MNRSIPTTPAHDAMALIGRVLIALLFAAFGAGAYSLDGRRAG